MPQRTNDYQQLVHLIQMAPAPVGAKVNESVMIPGQDTLREIDVLIETDVGPYSVKIAVEAKDFKRPLNVTEIEAVIGKYSGNGGIAVNKVVVVAKRGFSDAAEKRAKEARIELLTIKEAKESDWSKLAPETMCFRMEPHIDRVDLVPPISATSSGGNPISNGRIVCKCHGNDKGSPAQWANWFLKTQVLPNTALLERLEQEAKRRGGQIMAAVPLPLPGHNFLYDGRTCQIDELVFNVHYVHATGKGKWSALQMEGPENRPRSLDQLDVTLGGTRIRTVFPDGLTSQRIALRFDNAPLESSCSAPEVTEPTTMQFNMLPTEKCPLHFEQVHPNGHQPPSPVAPHAKGSPIYGTFPRPSESSTKKKVGRNSPCPCGSGRKFKHCCLKRV